MTKITATNGEYVATASLDSMLMVWDAEAKKTYECQEQAIITTMSVGYDSFGIFSQPACGSNMIS